MRLTSGRCLERLARRADAHVLRGGELVAAVAACAVARMADSDYEVSVVFVFVNFFFSFYEAV